jgi:hypothetical protein
VRRLVELVDVGALVVKITRWCATDYYFVLGDIFGPANLIKTGESVFTSALKGGPLIKGRIEKGIDGLYFKEGGREMAILFSFYPLVFEKGTRGWEVEGWRYGAKGLYYFIYIDYQRDDGLWEKRTEIAIKDGVKKWTLRLKEGKWQVVDFVDKAVVWGVVREPEEVSYYEPDHSLLPYGGYL